MYLLKSIEFFQWHLVGSLKLDPKPLPSFRPSRVAKCWPITLMDERELKAQKAIKHGCMVPNLSSRRPKSSTLDFLITKQVRLLFSLKNTGLCTLIPNCAFINFEAFKNSNPEQSPK